MSLRVIIVEDCAPDRFMLAKYLRRVGYDVVAEAEDGESGVEAYRTHRPDLVFMDLVLPKMNGSDAARAILTLDPAARVVGISGLSQPSVQGEALAAGMVGFMVKPVSFEDIEFELSTLEP